MSRIGKSTETENRLVVSRALEGDGNGKRMLNGDFFLG